jgi:GR25 family glycosyltransferase involved in LPS biosynthesis
MLARVINISERTERWNQVKEVFSKVTTLQIGKFDAVKDNPGWRGLISSHRNAIFEAKMNKEKMMILLEDDIILSEDFDSRFPKILRWLEDNENWDIFYGGHTFAEFENIISKELAIVKGKFLTAHFIIINSKVYDRILASDINNPIDLFYRQNGFNTITTTPMLAWQRPSYSDIEKRDVEYYNYFAESEEKIDWVFHCQTLNNLPLKEPPRDPKWDIIKGEIFFCSFDIYNYFKYAHARAFVNIAKMLRNDKIVLLRILPQRKFQGWIFADQYMIPHAKLYANENGNKLAVVVAKIEHYDSGWDADLVIDHLGNFLKIKRI